MASANRKQPPKTTPPVPLASADRAQVAFDADQLKYLRHWIVEREGIRALRAKGDPKPWTTDSVLQQNRFCNVRRMDDKVSVWLLEHWYKPLRKATPRELLTMATLARHINWPDTLKELDQYVQSNTQPKWNAKAVLRVLEHRAKRGDKVFTGAYIINGARGGSKVSQVVDTVDWVWKHADVILPVSHSMEVLHKNLSNAPGIGSFMAGQIVADLRHTSLLANAYDAMVWAPRGPGSTRGMNRLRAVRPLHSSYTDNKWQLCMTTLWRVLWANSSVRHVFESRKCELMDLQNCLCEFDKYMRVLTGEGRARNRYPGT